MLNAEEQSQLFEYMRANRKRNNGEITTDELNARLMALPQRVRNVVLATAQISFEVVE